MRSQVNQVASSSSSSAHVPVRKRKWTRDELLQGLEIIGELPIPPPSCLPPRSSSGRSRSPGMGNKRKRGEFTGEQERSKRPRVSAMPADLPPPLPHSALPGPSRPPPVHVVRRPRREHAITFADVEYDSRRIESEARALKYSADARSCAALPATSPEYKPLANPPPTNSPYHVHGSILGRLELLDALVGFTYGRWMKDYHRKGCQNDSWTTDRHLIQACQKKWADNISDDREKALLGLTFLIEGFIELRKGTYLSTQVGLQTIEFQREIDVQRLAIMNNASAKAKVAHPPTPTPPMLPSPLTESANSTPSGQTHDAACVEAARDEIREAARVHAASFLPSKVDQAYFLSVARVTHYLQKGNCLTAKGYHSLTLPVLAKHFPKTFARVIHSTLSHNEEQEPNYEDRDGELFWPGTCSTGEGIGWLSLLGQAMIQELGEEYGYKGLKGVIPKP